MTAGASVTPVVSIGLPVYNGEHTVARAIESLLSQTFTDFELIISDNASTDRTEEICRSYAKQDSRIRYIRQEENIGPTKNLAYVFEQACGEYFMWAPAHYERSANFIEANLQILQANPKCAFSSTPNCWVGEEGDEAKHVTFCLEGGLYERVAKFLDNCWLAHACFYALFRRELMEDCRDISQYYLAFDWVVMLHLLFKGEFKRSSDGLLVVGKGSSSQPGYISKTRTSPVHYIFPLYEFSKRITSIILTLEELSAGEKLALLSRVYWLNVTVQARQIRGWLSGAIKGMLGNLVSLRER